MARAHDIPHTELFVQVFRYPRVVERLPLRERGADVREVADPYRVGRGTVARVPLTRYAVVVGRWSDAGGDPDERTRQALRARELSEVESDEVLA